MLWSKLKPILIGMAFLVGSAAMADDMKTKTYCIGRFLIDVPEEFELVQHDGTVRVLDVDRVGEGDPEDLENTITERVRALKNGEVAEQIFRSVEQVGDLTIITRWDDLSVMGLEPSEPWTEDAYVLSDGVIFHLSGVGTEKFLPVYRDNIQTVARAIHPRDPDEIPNGAVTCLQDVFFKPPPGGEYISATFAHVDDSPLFLEFSTVVRNADGSPMIFDEFKSVPGVQNKPISIAGFEGRELRSWGDRNDLYASVGQQVSETQPGYELTIRFSDSRENAGSEPATRDDVERMWSTVIHSIREKE